MTPEAWTKHGALLIHGPKVYRFLLEYEQGQVRCDGTQPWIADVLQGTGPCHYTNGEGAKGRSYVNGKRVVSALTKFQEKQYNLIGLNSYQRLKDCTNVKRFPEESQDRGPHCIPKVSFNVNWQLMLFHRPLISVVKESATQLWFHRMFSSQTTEKTRTSFFYNISRNDVFF